MSSLRNVVASSFLEGLERLTADEQGFAKQAAFDLQHRPDRPGFQLHRVEGQDPQIWCEAADGLEIWPGHAQHAADALEAGVRGRATSTGPSKMPGLRSRGAGAARARAVTCRVAWSKLRRPASVTLQQATEVP